MDKCTINEENTENSKGYSTDLCYSEIQRFVGWSIFSRRKVVAKAIKRLENSKKVKVREIEMLSQEATLLEFMSTCREDVKMDTEYMSMYYPNVDQIYDEGGLTLVSKPFVK